MLPGFESVLTPPPPSRSGETSSAFSLGTPQHEDGTEKSTPPPSEVLQAESEELLASQEEVRRERALSDEEIKDLLDL